MARAVIQVDRHEAEFRWEAKVEGHILTGSVATAAFPAVDRARAWVDAARAVSRLVSSFKGDS
jgi:hypothetical protein